MIFFPTPNKVNEEEIVLYANLNQDFINRLKALSPPKLTNSVEGRENSMVSTSGIFGVLKQEKV